MENNEKLKQNAQELKKGLELLSRDRKVVLPHNKAFDLVDELQEKVWSYQSDIETHTVETHIYRLRKKISNTFDDNDFVISEKNGYQIN